MELDDLLPDVEAGELLNMVAVKEGDLLLTPLGQAYADASIFHPQGTVAGRVLRVPTINWIYETLQQDDNQRVAKEYFLDKLSGDFGDWGRNNSTRPLTGAATPSCSPSMTIRTSCIASHS